ncbi:DUF2336 domain-containing protein [Pleomorphomonas carboxyditropha]|uniref:DUF2336 domain-containing protein n=1 Tax=Pleomorphomonas carboxyditropha TaxID=2023338 RepID=A0A2G9WRW1_9HYPH|nr:DUF2336 domain-containing protein [Pleomorphomonas carboxyditropha]PIO97385.1 hypothetical protein CJ014_20375 [Pleomorphomonas carboxyditropha]
MMFDRLIALSQEKSSDSRRDLLVLISELFTDGAENHTDAETKLFGDILCRLVDQVSVDVRARVSAEMAPLGYTPRALALRLASDEALVVSGVMLEQSEALTDGDLRDLAGSLSQGHLLAITRRKGLGETVTEVLADRGDGEVLEGVTNNATARFSDVGLERLATRGLDYPKVLIALSRRADMPPDRLVRAVASFDAEARAKLENLAALSPDFAALLVTEAADVARQRKQELEQEISCLLRRIRQRLVTLDEAIAGFAQEGRMEAVAELLTQVSGLEEAHIANVLNHDNDFGLAVVCRSLNIGDEAYLKLSRLRAEHLGQAPSAAEAWAGNYAEIDRASADRALYFHRMRMAALKSEKRA